MEKNIICSGDLVISRDDLKKLFPLYKEGNYVSLEAKTSCLGGILSDVYRVNLSLETLCESYWDILKYYFEEELENVKFSSVGSAVRYMYLYWNDTRTRSFQVREPGSPEELYPLTQDRVGNNKTCPSQYGWHTLLQLSEQVFSQAYVRVCQAETELISIMDGYGFKKELVGNSGIITRRAVWYYTKNQPEVIEVLVLDRDYCTVYETVQKEIYHDISDVEKALEESKGELERQKLVKAEEAFLKATKDGYTALIEAVSGTYGDTPVHPDWQEVWSVRTACTSDRRYGIGHTYLVLYVNMKALKSGQKLKISIPDQYKGMFIGKGGSNIKSLQQKLGCKIILV